MTTIPESAIADPAAFRAVFAPPGHAVILALVDSGKAEALIRVAEMTTALRKNGTAARLVVYGDTNAILPDAQDVGFLERWSHPLLPAVLTSAEVVVPLSEEAESLLKEHRATGARMPVVLRDADQLRDHFRPRSLTGRGSFILQNDWGIGDELLLSAVARELIRAYPGTDVWIRSRYGFRFPSFVQQGPIDGNAKIVETIYQNPTLYGPGAHSPFPGHLVQQMLDKVALDTGLKVKAKDVRPELDLRPTAKTAMPSVVLHSRPNPRLPSKDWGLARWQELAKTLKSAGVLMRQVGNADEPLLPGVEDLRGTPVHELPEIVAAAWAVVSVVGFLMHLAEAAGIPAIVIYGGREHPAIDGYPDQVHLSSEPLACRGRWGCHLGPDLDCPHGMKCMENLTPDLVARSVLSALRGREGR